MRVNVDLEFSEETVMAIASAANHSRKSISEWMEYCIVLHTEMFHATDAGSNTPPLTDPTGGINISTVSETSPALDTSH
jgi:hypothetical protein